MSRVDDFLMMDSTMRSSDSASDGSPEAKRIKVLHLAAGNIFGGIETFLLALARSAQLEPMMTSEFAVCFPGRFRDELSSTGRTVHDLGPVRISRPWTVFRARRRLARILKTSRPDRVVVHGAWTQAIFGPIVRKNKVALVLHVHGPSSADSLLDGWARRVPIDLMITNSAYTLRESHDLHPDAPRQVCRCPVERIREGIRRREDVRRELETSSDAVVIIQVSRMERWKGQHVLIEALSLLPSELDWRCWVVGGPQRPAEAEYERDLKTLAAASGRAERIKFLGQRSDVPDLLGAADIFCQPNTSAEPFGIVFIEALYAGLYVVTSHFGGGAEIVSPECGSLTAPGDAEALSKSLAGVIADSRLRRTAAAYGPRRAAELCDPKTQLHRLYEALLQLKNEAA